MRKGNPNLTDLFLKNRFKLELNVLTPIIKLISFNTTELKCLNLFTFNFKIFRLELLKLSDKTIQLSTAFRGISEIKSGESHLLSHDDFTFRLVKVT